ncbi:type III pantothenate kinase [Mucilaginibacter ginsenosidivorans]|uniref:Type III pantothenate kinase n=1 Tax=Mucilaginibacter ginsenosidivorans TaxID=398053 RepID=A0A5B8UQL6_9SPHI|nr:type III pantothenate kinase [Mucilaginibacter ginsenosidivorans]QEC61118.1 type III pantothenate kinase [Mucilaginibacter ginsenosidivorans]
MANLVIDIGNTLTKVAVFEQDDLLHAEQSPVTDAKTLLQLIEKYHISHAIISSVRNRTEEWRAAIEEKLDLKYFTRDMTAGIHNQYKSPETLGVDRLAAVMGAHKLYPGKCSLVIDAGTCITYDHVDADGNYLGGSISPGLNMRYKALNYYTGALPLVGADEKFDKTYGDDTRTAILSGVQNGVKYEVFGFIESYRAKEPELNILLSGGDSIFFDTLLKNSIFAPYVKNEPYLVLKGLNAAIRYNND